LYPAQTKNTGYRFYSINQLKRMLLINKLKTYQFTLDEIKVLLSDEQTMESKLLAALERKQKEIENKLTFFTETLDQIAEDMSMLKSGKNFLDKMEEVDIELVEVSQMYLLSKRIMVKKEDYPSAYQNIFGELFGRIQKDNLTIVGAPMVLFHSAEFSTEGMDTEFAIPVLDYVTGTRSFTPELCLKTVVKGNYEKLAAVYAKQMNWANEHGYQNNGTLFEVYIADPSEAASQADLVTEVYYPVKK